MGVNPADLAGLSVEEKLALISDLWDSIEESASLPALSDVQQQELARRRADGLADPSATVGWPEVRKKLFSQP